MLRLRVVFRKVTLRGDERGFTLQEMLVVLAIMGILLAIGIIIWLGILEQRRVDAAANQLVADLRLAHTSATNQLTDWRVVLVPKMVEDNAPDYYLVKLNAPYGSGSPTPTVFAGDTPIPRTFPANVRVMVQTNSSGATIQDTVGTYYLSPDPSITAGSTRTLEFNSDGAMTGYGGSPSGTVRVTIDDDPQRSIRYLAATSRIRILP